MLFFYPLNRTGWFALLYDLHRIDSSVALASNQDDSSIVAEPYEAEHAELRQGPSLRLFLHHIYNLFLTQIFEKKMNLGCVPLVHGTWQR